MDNKVEYSFTPGEWSKYNHCRKWTNGSYPVMVRDKYGQTSETLVEIVNAQAEEEIKNFPSLSYLYGSVSEEASQEVKWTIGPVYIHCPGFYTEGWHTFYSVNNGATWQQAASGQENFEILESGNVLFCYSKNNKMGKYSAATILLDNTPPTNINFVPTLQDNGYLDTVVTAINPENQMEYSITYDNGVSWTNKQISNTFVWKLEKGTHAVNVRVYNAAGGFSEGVSLDVVIV